MKRLVVIVEGDTEKEFMDQVLFPYLTGKGIYDCVAFKIKHTKGGMVRYNHLKTDILNVIREKNVFVTTFIDFYALPTDFPGYNKAMKLADKRSKVKQLSKSIVEDVSIDLGTTPKNLLPYIQLHEFEALVFSSVQKIADNFETFQVKLDDLLQIERDFPNPEDINDKKESAPSVRMGNCIQSYNKKLDGVTICKEIGMTELLNKCPGFKEWHDSLFMHLKQ